MKRVPSTLFAAACLTALFACTKSGPDRDGNQSRDFDDKSGAPAGVTTISGAHLGSLSAELSIDRLVAARCARETACTNVGTDRPFADHDVCARELRSRIGAELRASECALGIDSAALDACIEAIHSESCSNPIDTIQRLAACRAGALCVKVSEKAR